MPRLLIVDDDLSLREFLTIFLRKEGYEVEVATNGQRALELLEESPFDVVLTDLRMPRMGGLELLDAVRERRIQVQVIVMTAFSTTDTALEAMRKGAYDYIVKPFQLAEVKVIVQKCLEKGTLIAENQQLKRKLASDPGKRAQFVFRSAAMDEVVRLIKRVAPTPSSVLVLGESGTGKELVARMLHWDGGRAQKPFVAVNCGAIPEQLMESELFGHERGSFTDARATKRGLFEVAGNGMIFLDEIGELPLGMQSKLLRALENRKFRRVGGVAEIPLNACVIAATNRSLREEVRAGRFREDLFFRLHVLPIDVPSLRDRKEDIPTLVGHFIERLNKTFGRKVQGTSGKAMELLTAYRWPGNVRELRNVLERTVILLASDVIQPEDLPPELRVSAGRDGKNAACPFLLPEGGVDLEAVERGLLHQALERTSGNRTAAARLLGISRYALRYRLEKEPS